MTPCVLSNIVLAEDQERVARVTTLGKYLNPKTEESGWSGVGLHSVALAPHSSTHTCERRGEALSLKGQTLNSKPRTGVHTGGVNTVKRRNTISEVSDL